LLSVGKRKEHLLDRRKSERGSKNRVFALSEHKEKEEKKQTTEGDIYSCGENHRTPMWKRDNFVMRGAREVEGREDCNKPKNFVKGSPSATGRGERPFFNHRGFDHRTVKRKNRREKSENQSLFGIIGENLQSSLRNSSIGSFMGEGEFPKPRGQGGNLTLTGPLPQREKSLMQGNAY